MDVKDIIVDENAEQMKCPNCGQPLNIDLKGVDIIALCCGAHLEADAETLIAILPEVGDPKKEN